MSAHEPVQSPAMWQIKLKHDPTATAHLSWKLQSFFAMRCYS